jgi:hypothetical protein
MMQVQPNGRRPVAWRNKQNKALIMFMKLTVISNALALLFNIKEIPNRGGKPVISDHEGKEPLFCYEMAQKSSDST